MSELNGGSRRIGGGTLACYSVPRDSASNERQFHRLRLRLPFVRAKYGLKPSRWLNKSTEFGAHSSHRANASTGTGGSSGFDSACSSLEKAWYSDIWPPSRRRGSNREIATCSPLGPP